MLDYAEHVQATVPKTQKVRGLLKPALTPDCLLKPALTPDCLLKPALTLTPRLPMVCSRPSPRSTRLMTLWLRVRHGAIHAYMVVEFLFCLCPTAGFSLA